MFSLLKTVVFKLYYFLPIVCEYNFILKYCFKGEQYILYSGLWGIIYDITKMHYLLVLTHLSLFFVRASMPFCLILLVLCMFSPVSAYDHVVFMHGILAGPEEFDHFRDLVQQVLY